MAQQYTIDEAKAQIEAAGHQWTPEIEANLRAKGRIRDANPGPSWANLSLGEKIKHGFESLAGYVPGGYGYDPTEREMTGTSAAEQFIGRGLKAGTFGFAGPEVPPPATSGQQFAGNVGHGIGVGARMAPLAFGATALVGEATMAPALTPVANEFLRNAVVSGLTFAGDRAIQDTADRVPFQQSVKNQAEAAGQGVAWSALPRLPVIGRVMENPVGGRLVGSSLLTGMNMAEGMPFPEAAATGIASDLGMAIGSGHIGGGSKTENRPKAAKAPKNASANVEADMAALEALRTAPEGAPAPEASTAAEAPKAPEQPRMTYYGTGETVPSFSVTEVPGANPGDPVRRVFRRNEPTSIAELVPKSPAPGPGAVIGETPAPEAAPAPAAPSVVDMRGRPVGAQEAPTPEIVPPGYRKPTGSVDPGADVPLSERRVLGRGEVLPVRTEPGASMARPYPVTPPIIQTEPSPPMSSGVRTGMGEYPSAVGGGTPTKSSGDRLAERMSEYDAKMQRVADELEAKAQEAVAKSRANREAFSAKQAEINAAETDRSMKRNPTVVAHANALHAKFESAAERLTKLLETEPSGGGDQWERDVAAAESDLRAANSEATRFGGLSGADALAEASAHRRQILGNISDALDGIGGQSTRKPTGDVTLGMGPLQAAWEAAVKAGKGRGRQLREGVRPDWERLKKVVGMPVEEMPDSVPFSGYNNGQKRWEDAMSEIEAAPRPVKDLTPQSAIDSHMRPDTVARTEAENAGRIKNIPDKAAPEVKAQIAQENVDLTNQALHPDVVAQLDAGFTKNILGVRGNAQAGVTDPTRKMQQVNDGRLAAPIEMQQLHGGLVIDAALKGRGLEIGRQYNALKESTGVSGKSDMEIAGKLRDQYDPKEPIQTFLNKPGVMDLLRQSGKPQQMLEYVKGLREMENALRDDVNRVRRSLGQNEIGEIGAYFRKIAAKPKFFDIVERTKRSRAKKQVVSSRTSDTEQAFNAAGLHRSSTDPNTVELDGRLVPRNWNAEEVFQGYVDTMLRSIGGDLALNQSMILVTNMENRAQVLRSAGDTHAADQMDIRAEIIRNIAQQQWNHQLYGASRGFENLVNMVPGVGSNIRDTLAWNKRQFDNTKYRLNPRFTFGVQGLSTWTPVFRDPVAGLLALRDIAFDPKARDYAMSTFQAKIKNSPQSTLRSQIEGGGSLGEVIKSGTSKRNKVRRTADFVTDGMTQGVENFSDMFAALADYHLNNKNPNLTERQRVISSGQAVFKTQSAFTFEHRPSILNSKFLQGMFPAQGFKFEVVNQLREAFGEVGVDSRLYGAGRADQARDAFAILASAAMQNWFQNGLMNMMAGKDAEESFTPDSLRDAVMTLPPVIYAFLPGSVTGNDRAQYPLPAGQVDQLVKAGKQKNLRKTVAVAAGNWGGVGGAAVNDILRGRYSAIGIGSKDWQDPTSDFGDGGNSQPTTSRTVVRPQVQSRKTVTRAIPARRR